MTEFQFKPTHLAVVDPPGIGDNARVPRCTIAHGHTASFSKGLGGYWSTCVQWTVRVLGVLVHMCTMGSEGIRGTGPPVYNGQ